MKPNITILKTQFRFRFIIHIFSILLFIFVFDNHLSAQYIREWAKQFGGDMADYAYTAIQDKDGRLVFAGKVVKRQTDTWVVVTDTKGQEIWGKTYSDSYLSGAQQIIETSDGNYLLAGFVQKRKRDRNLNGYLMKISKQGKPLWQKRYGGNADDALTDVVEMPDGGFMAVGYSYSNEDEEKTFWVVKTDKSGNLRKEKFFGDTEEDAANALIRTSDNAYIAVGYASSGAGKNMRLIKFDENCETIWDMPSEYSDIREIHDLIELPDSTVAAIGTERIKGLDYDAFVMRFTLAGDTIFDRTYGYGTWEEATCITKTFDGNIAIGGYEKTESGAFSDFWMRKTDYYGKELYYDVYRRKTIDYPESIIELSDNGILLTGHTWHIQQGWDYAVLKYKDANKTDIRFQIPQTSEASTTLQAYSIKACITSFAQPVRADVIADGIIQISDAYSPLTMSEPDCMYPVLAETKLKPGKNIITVAVKDKRGNIVTAERIINYIPPTEMSW